MEEQQQYSPRPPPGIVLLNRHYFPDHDCDGFTVGATSFALSVIECLRKHRLLLGAILYQRDDAIDTPVLEERVMNRVHVVVVRFNFSMPRAIVRGALTSAIGILGRRAEVPPVVYYQTDVLLAYHPERYACCVTHHGPFVEDFAARYSVDEAHDAYGGRDKVKHLTQAQRNGIDALRSLRRVHVLQHSELQRDFLVRQGIDDRMISVVSPPILCNAVPETDLGEAMDAFLAKGDDALVLLSNVARVDYFKHQELLVRAAVALHRHGRPVRLLITGGAMGDEYRRQALRDLVPTDLKANVLVTERLDQGRMLALFKRLRCQAIFVCTSRYETLGITPLEAALSGVCTLAPDLDCVELSRHFPAAYRFGYSVAALVDRIAAICDAGAHRGEDLLVHLQKAISQRRFEDTFMAAWRSMSDSR